LAPDLVRAAGRDDHAPTWDHRRRACMKLWTAWSDYYATGEGRSLFAWIGYAEGRTEALKSFGSAFDEYFAQGAEAVEGVVENDVTRHLFSQTVLDSVREMQGRAIVDLIGRLHFNLA
jgi:hypothetical protein